jgi:site-specific DNA-methyltransferase (adenine-specific)
LKPGGHLLAFGGTRTWHRLAVAIEDAGFEIRDNIAWLYGSGFPKSHNISKAIDKAAGAEREVITDDARAWDGWGTALKPAHEPIVVARKPVEGTVAANVLTYGTGALNIDATRIVFTDTETDNRIGTDFISNNGDASNNANDNQVPNKHYVQMYKSEGRWPANIILDEYTAELLDEQSGLVKGGVWNNTAGARHFNNDGKPTDYVSKGSDKTIGGASRFFYVAKASKRDRNEGLDQLPEIQTIGGGGTNAELDENGYLRTDSAGGKYGSIKAVKQNFHPTVKPTALMQYLIRLVTPPNGIVLDPFAGSGSTGKAAILENKRFIGIELTAEYLPIIEGRLQHALETINTQGDDLFE